MFVSPDLAVRRFVTAELELEFALLGAGSRGAIWKGLGCSLDGRDRAV
jgi:hypothetical protein